MTASASELHRSAFTPVVVCAFAFLFLYWGLYALLVPVTVWDSQTYNLARLLIARQGGLFGNDGWNSDRQVMFPWSFDAVHYPFLALGGWGVALPSFACFVGIAWVIFRLACEVRGTRTAWWCVLTLFSLPTLMYQASSTKNDLAVVFALACWLYAFWLWRREPSRALLGWMALALGFAAGAKSSGVPLALLLGAFSAWHLRGSKRALLEFSGALLVAAFLCGSVEIYANNKRVYGQWFGPAETINENRNRDGLRGAAANLVRYVVANQNMGIDVGLPASTFPAKLEHIARTVLQATALKDVGYRADLDDAKLSFLKRGTEAASDYGPVGGLAILAAILFLFLGPIHSLRWRLASLGLGSLVLTSATVGWMPWNARFLLLPFILCSVALTIQILDWSGARRLPAAVWLAVLLFSALAYPWYSYNKRPKDLWDSLAHRPRLAMKERTNMKEVVDAVEQLGRPAHSHPTVFLCAGTDSWTLPLLQLRSVRCVPAPGISPEDLGTARSEKDARYLLVLNHGLDPALLPQLEWIQTFAEPDTFLYRIRSATTLREPPGP